MSFITSTQRTMQCDGDCGGSYFNTDLGFESAKEMRRLAHKAGWRHKRSPSRDLCPVCAVAWAKKTKAPEGITP